MRDHLNHGRGRGHHDDDPPGPPWRRGGRTRRGDIRTALLAVLAEGPGHGYEIIQRIEEKSGGSWRPSPGSVYPTLQLLEDEGLVAGTERDGKRVYAITDEGRAEAQRRVEEAGGEPWATGGRGGAGAGQLRDALHQLVLATRQVMLAGAPAQAERAAAILNDARKRLYQLLSEE